MSSPDTRDSRLGGNASDSGPATSPVGNWSIERKLPLLVASVLTAIVLATMGLAYTTLTRAARRDALERLRSAGHQLASLSEASTGVIRSQLTDAARETVLVRAVEASAVRPGSAAGKEALRLAEARVALGRLLTPNDSGRPVELWTARGERIAYVGNDVRSVLRPGGREGESTPLGPLREGLEHVSSSDSAQVGGLYRVGEQVYFWALAPVRAGGRPLGYVAKQYRIGSGRDAGTTVRALTGNETEVLVGNVDGGVWAKLSGEPASPPPDDDGTPRGQRGTRAEEEDALVFRERVAGTPFVIAREPPADGARRAPRFGRHTHASFFHRDAGRYRRVLDADAPDHTAPRVTHGGDRGDRQGRLRRASGDRRRRGTVAARCELQPDGHRDRRVSGDPAAAHR